MLNRYRILGATTMMLLIAGCALKDRTLASPSLASPSYENSDLKGEMRSKLLPSSKVGAIPFGTGFDPRAKEIEKSLGIH